MANQLTLDVNDSEEDSKLNSIAVFEGFLPVFNHTQHYDSLKKPKQAISKNIIDSYFNNYHFLLGKSQYEPPQHLI